MVARQAKPAIGRCRVRSNQIYLVADGLLDEAVNRVMRGIVDNLASNVAFACNRSDDSRLAGAVRSASGELRAILCMAVSLLAANVSFVDFDNAHKLPEIVVIHRGAEPMANVPSRMRRRAFPEEHAANLARRYAFLRLEHRVENFEPRRNWNVRIFEDGPDQNRKPIGIGVLVGLRAALPRERPRTAFVNLSVSAKRTLRSGRPTAQREICPASGFVGERRHKLLERLHNWRA